MILSIFSFAYWLFAFLLSSHLFPWAITPIEAMVTCHLSVKWSHSWYLELLWNIYIFLWIYIQFSSVQFLSRVRLFVTPWTTAHQASPSITVSRSPPKPMSIKSAMPSNHLILCHPLLLLPSVFPSIRVFSNESVRVRRLKYWSFSFSISPSSEYEEVQEFIHPDGCCCLQTSHLGKMCV